MNTSASRTRVKICGITRIEDAITAIEHGVDALGFVFYEPSPRYVDIPTAVEICRKLPPFVNKVALFVNAEEDWIEDVLQAVDIDLIQFHGDEDEEECIRYRKPYIKALRVSADSEISCAVQQYPAARGILLDAYVKGVHGGTGQAFDWSLIPGNLDKPIILAGGLKPDNVRQAIETVKPYAVDVSGGVEQAKGIKDPEKISVFMQEVIHARQ